LALGFSGSGTVVARARAIIEADTSGVSSGMKKAESDFDRSSRQMEANAMRLRSALEFGASSAAFQVAFQKIDEAGRSVFDRWKEEQTTIAQTHAVLKSTGHAAGVTAEQVGRLSKSLQDKSGVDKTVIQSGANMLLTFTNIRNEAGKGNDVYTQSTKTLLDMATALHEDVPKAAIQLGKALNDPVKGMTALRRVGVAFTQGQQDQVKALVNSGHALDAQKLILKELNREFGGSAKMAGETLPGKFRRMKFAVEDAAISYAQRLEPAVAKFVDKAESEIKTIAHSETAHKALKVGVELLKDAFVGARTVVEVFVDLMHNKTVRTLSIITAGVWALNTAVDANPFAALATAAVIAVGLIVRHWSAISGWFQKLWHTISNAGSAAFEALKQVAKGAVYVILQEATAALRGVLYVASKLPFVGGKAKSALHAIDDFISKWKPNFSKVNDAWSQDGTKAGQAFAQNAAAAIEQADPTGKATAALGRTGAAGAGVAGGGTGSTLQRNIVKTAKSQIGIPYQYGGQVALNVHTDCSGLAIAVLRHNGINVSGRTTFDLWRQGTPVSVGQLQPGDLVFFYMTGKGPDHVGVYIGNDQFVEDPHTGSSVRISTLSTYPSYCGARRYTKTTASAGKPSAGSSTPTASPSAALLTTDDFTNSTAANAKKAAAAAKKAASARSAADLRTESLRELRVTAKSVTDEAVKLAGEAKAKVRPLVADVRKILANPQPTSADLKRLRYDLGQIKTVVSKAASEAKKAAAVAVAKAKREIAANTLRDTEKQIEAEFPLLSDSLKANARPLMGEVGNLLAKGIVPTAAQLARAKTDLGKLKAIVKQAVADAKTALDSEKQGFENSWSDLANKIGTAFDAATSKGLANVTASTSFGTIGVNQKTPAEIALAQLQAAHDAQQAADDMAAAQAAQAKASTDLQTALASGDPATIASAKQAYEDASKQVADLAYNAKVAELQAQADAQRNEADNAINAAQAQYQTQRDLQKTALDNQLSDLKDRLETGKETYSQYMTDVSAILNDPNYGVSIAETGDTLGSMFADAFTASFNSVTGAINQMIDSLNRYNALVGKPAVGKVAPVGAVGGGTQSKPGGKVKDKTGGYYDPSRGVYVPAKFATGAVAFDQMVATIGDGPSPEVVVPISAEVAAQLARPSGSSFARLSTSTRDRLSGVIERAVGGHTDGVERPNVTVVNHFTAQPEDPDVWLRKSKHSAEQVFGT
jgi:cell wall-associated NlpC family hydrolase